MFGKLSSSVPCQINYSHLSVVQLHHAIHCYVFYTILFAPSRDIIYTSLHSTSLTCILHYSSLTLHTCVYLYTTLYTLLYFTSLYRTFYAPFYTLVILNLLRISLHISLLISLHISLHTLYAPL